MFDYRPRLVGDLLRLRPVSADDWTGLSAVGCDPEVWAGHPDRERYREENFRRYFEDGLASRRALVAVDPDDVVLGWSRYSHEFVEPNEVEVGWTFLGRAYWGGDHNREMKALMLSHAFQFVDRVILRIAENNGRSQRAAEKIGAKLIPGRVTPGSAGSPASLYYGIDRLPDRMSA